MNYRANCFPRSACNSFLGRLIAMAVCCLILSSKVVFAQDEQANSIEWQQGPCTVSIAGVAEIRVPAGYQFTGSEGAAIFWHINGNPPSDIAGVLVPSDSFDWHLYFIFEEGGYVPDDDKDLLDADDILEVIRAATEEDNETRRKNSWPEIHVMGWIYPPAYDESTNNLTWAVRGKTSDGEGANYDIRLLGRRGVMQVKLIASPAQLDSYVPTIKGLLTDFQFRSGEKYAEFRAGDKVAKYGLAALIIGLGPVAAQKMGVLAKLGAFFAKMGKTIIFLGMAALAALAGLWKMLTGKSTST